jgi:hypothetical protein
MNKRQILASLNNISNHLDNNALYSEANILTNIMKRLAVSPDDIIGEDDIPSRKSPKSEIGGYNQEKANMMDFLSSTVSQLSEDELPRWIKEKRDRSQNPQKPEVLNPSVEEQRQKVDDIFPTFMQYYEQFWDQHNVALPSGMDPREINNVTEYYLVIGQGDPVDFLKTYHVINSPDYKDSSRYIDWYKENFDFMVEHMKFIDDFQKSNNLDRSTMFALLDKSRK